MATRQPQADEEEGKDTRKSHFMDGPCESRPREDGEGWLSVGRLVLFTATLWFFLYVSIGTPTMRRWDPLSILPQIDAKPTPPPVVLREKRKNMFSPYFPDTIPHYEVRRDDRTGQFVSRGDVYKKLSLMPEVLDFGEAHFHTKKRFKPEELIEIKKKRVSFAEMQAAYQCAPHEPDFDTSSGTVSLLRMAPPTMKTVEWVCAYAETRCGDHQSCLQHIAQFKNSTFRNSDPDSREFGVERTSAQNRDFYLLRVKNNELYYDWPWGRGRIKFYAEAKNNGSELLRVDDVSSTYHEHAMLLNVVRILHVNDSLFFTGNENPSLPWLFPFPSFSYAPAMGTGEMPWPWTETWRNEIHLHRNIMENGGNFADDFIAGLTHQKPWHDRLPKAAFFATYRHLRRLVWDQAVLRPDLIDAPIDLTAGRGDGLGPWNKNSMEPSSLSGDQYKSWVKTNNGTDKASQPGFISWLSKVSRNKSEHYIPGRYKYIVVVGYEMSTTGRMAQLLAHSGAVILTPKSPFSYHFSARLLPWVHYVPLSYSSADLIEKIEWLINHDTMAQQIAENAKNFGKSYLRLEDYFCYIGAALTLTAEVEQSLMASTSSSSINATSNSDFPIEQM